MNHKFVINMPCGAVDIVIGLPPVADRLAVQMIPAQHEQVVVRSLRNMTSKVDSFPEVETEVKQEVHRLLKVYGKEDFMSVKDLSHQSAFQEHRQLMIRKFVAERLKVSVSKKKVEFYVPNLNLAEVEKLGYKYLENMGSESSVLSVFKLSDYHKFAAMIDVADAFKLFLTEDGRGELAEVNPDKWVLGRYGEDNKLMEEMSNMRRYQF